MSPEEIRKQAILNIEKVSGIPFELLVIRAKEPNSWVTDCLYFAEKCVVYEHERRLNGKVSE